MHTQLSSGTTGLKFGFAFVFVPTLRVGAVKALARLHRGTDSTELSLLVYGISTRILWLISPFKKYLL